MKRTTLTTLLSLVLTANAFGFTSTGEILVKEKWGLTDSSPENLRAVQAELIEELRGECLPIETRAIDVIEASENHTESFDENGLNPTYNYGVKVKVYCR